MTVPDAGRQWAWLARIRRPQGRKGEVFADILTDFPEKFDERKQLWLIADPDSPPPQRPPRSAANLPLQVDLQAHWLHKGGIVLHFAGCDSISAAEAFAGLIVTVPIEQRAPLGEGEVYIADLIGCTLFDVAGPAAIEIGRIEDVDRSSGPVALLVVRGRDSGQEILVPFAKSYLRSLDTAAGRVEMALPEGLANLNASNK